MLGPDDDDDDDELRSFVRDVFASNDDDDSEPWNAILDGSKTIPESPSSIEMSPADDRPISTDADGDHAAEPKGDERLWSDMATVGSTVGTALEVTNERRRQRHRAAMARYRQEQRQRIEQMQAQEQALRRILMAQLSHRKPTPGLLGDARSWPQRLQMRYTEAVRAREALFLERDRLTKEIHAYTQRSRVVSSLTEQLHNRQGLLTTTTSGVWLRYRDGEAPFFFEFVSAEHCHRATQLGLRRMGELLRQLPKQPQPPSIATQHACLGWYAERALTVNEHGRRILLFRFSRRLARDAVSRDLAELHEMSWRIITKPDVMARSSASAVRSMVVQEVRDDIMVMLRNAPEKKGGRGRYLSLNTKLRDRERAAVFTLIMNRAPGDEDSFASSTDGSHAMWLRDGCGLLRFTERHTPAHQLEIEYMGFLECMGAEHADHMWTELSLLMLLWEQAVIPQRVLSS